FMHGEVFLSGDYLVHTGTRIVGAKGAGRATVFVWDVKNNRRAWEVDGTPAGVDARHVYTFEGDALLRRPLDGKGKAERLSLSPLAGVLAFQPPKLFGLVVEKKQWVATLLDLSTGSRTEYDFRGPTGRHITTGARPGRLHRPI